MENLESLGFSCNDISIFRTRKGTANFGDKTLENHGNRHAIFYNLQDALAGQPDVVFITNPTSLHIPIAIEAASAGCHLFIEKPLSHTMTDIDTLIEIVARKKIIAFVGYNRRFHPLLQQMKNWLVTEQIGKVASIHAQMSERITDWHPWENYKISYATRSDLGGGVILTQCHELDYLYSLFGKPKWIFAAGGELGNFEIEVEDTCKSILEFKNNVIASLHVDYLKRPAAGFLEITGTTGRIRWDCLGRTANLIPIKGEVISITDPILKPGDSWIANTYLIELAYFLNCIRSGIQPLPDLKQGKDVLEMLLATKKSLTNKQLVYL